MKKIKEILTIKTILAFVFGVLITSFFFYNSANSNLNVRFISSFELRQPSVDHISIRGSYKNESGIDNVNLECYLQDNICREASSYFLRDGVFGMGIMKDYTVIEKTPTKVVAVYEGIAAIHSFIIELDKHKVTFKNQSKNDPSDVRLYELENGVDAIKKSIE